MSNNRRDGKRSRNYIKPVDSASRHDRTGKSGGHIIDGNARNERDMQRLAYIESLNQLRMHAPLIWKRNVFFMTVQGALMVYVFDKFANLMFFQKLILCTLGLTCSIAWLIITKSGQTIQRKWRKLAIQKENNYFKYHDGPLQTASQQIGEGSNKSISITTVLIYLTWTFLSLWVLSLITLVVETCISASFSSHQETLSVKRFVVEILFQLSE